MSSKVTEESNDSDKLPDELTIGKHSFEFLIVTDTSAENALELKERFTKKTLFSSVEEYEKKRPFYDPLFDDNPLRIWLSDNATVNSVLFNEENIDAQLNEEDVGDFYKDLKSGGKLELFEDAEYEEMGYLFPNGAFIHKFRFRIDEEVNTNDIIFLTNTIAKLNPEIRIKEPGEADETSFNIEPRHERVKEEVYDVSGPAINNEDTHRKYTTIVINELGPEIEDILHDDKSLRADLFTHYREEFHALSVRKIEEWEKRYVEGADFDEKNIATSSVGFMRVNFRNTVIYDYPYSEETVRSLYSYGIMELLSWQLLATVYLKTTSEIIQKASSQNRIKTKDLSLIEGHRYEVMKSMEEFHTHVTTPSYRARNFYTEAIDILGIDNIIVELESQIEDIEEIVNNEYNAMQSIEDRRFTIFLLTLEVILAGSLAVNIGTYLEIGAESIGVIFLVMLFVLGLIYIFLKWTISLPSSVHE